MAFQRSVCVRTRDASEEVGKVESEGTKGVLTVRGVTCFIVKLIELRLERLKLDQHLSPSRSCVSASKARVS